MSPRGWGLWVYIVGLLIFGVIASPTLYCLLIGGSLSLSLSLSVVSRRGVVHLQHLCHSRGFGGCVVAVGLWVVAVVFALAWGLLGVAHATVADVRAGTYCKLTFLSSGGFDMWCFKFLFNLLNSLLTKPFSAV